MNLQDDPEFKDFFHLLEDICKSAAELLHASASSIYLKRGETVVMHAAYGYSESLIHKAEYKIGEGITGWVAEGNEYIANSREEISGHPKHVGKYDAKIWEDGKSDCHSIVAIPLFIGNDVYGLIKVENKSTCGKNEQFTQVDLTRLKIFLDALSHALQQNKKLWLTLGKYSVFVLMPFRDEFLNIYDCIKQAAEKESLFCTKVNDGPIVGKISAKIYNSINKSDIIVAVMSGKNPNVFYETGYSHAKNKPTILLAENSEEIPFDLKDFNHIIYNSGKLPFLRDELVRYFAFVKSNMLGTSGRKDVTANWI